MQWSKLSSSILKREIAQTSVLEFVPQKFEMGTPSAAMDYLANKAHGSDFRMSDPSRVQTGIDDIEMQSEEERIENRAIEKLKDIQEEAYAKAYELGREEGKAEAFNAVAAEVSSKLDELNKTLMDLAEMKKEILAYNEAHMVKLLFHMASRIARTHLSQNNDSMIEILKSAVGLAADEEKITVQVSATQFEFIEGLKKQTGREFDFLKKIRFEPNDSISPGGCIVETNYGEVDSRVEQRVEQLWSALQDNMPKVKDSLAS